MSWEMVSVPENSTHEKLLSLRVNTACVSEMAATLLQAAAPETVLREGERRKSAV